MMILPHFISDILNKDIKTSLNIKQYVELRSIIQLIVSGEEAEIRELRANPEPFTVRMVNFPHEKEAKIHLEICRKQKSNPSYSSYSSNQTEQVIHRPKPFVSNIPARLIPHPLLGRSGKDLAAGIDKDDEDSGY